MDRNTITGFVLIGIMLMVMLYVNSRSRLAYEAEQLKKQHTADSIAAVKAARDSVANLAVKAKNDSLQSQQVQQTLGGNSTPAQTVEVENDVMKIVFNSKGAQPALVTLKNYKKHDGSLVQLNNSTFSQLSYRINTGENKTTPSNEIIFTTNPVVKNADGSQIVSFTLGDSSGAKQITHRYSISKSDYLVDFDLLVNGATQLFSKPGISLNWQSEAGQIEKDHKYEKAQTEASWYSKGEYDFEHVGEGDHKNFTNEVNWLALKQQFFISAIAAKNKFSQAEFDWKSPSDTNTYIARAEANVQLAFPQGTNVQVPLQLYYGPSDYNVLKKYNNHMQEIVPYGSGIFSFVKYINRHVLLPVFDFLRKNVASMGIVILLLTLFIRLITSPILYNSYLSGAKMKALKPEVDALKAKHTDQKTGEVNQQQFGMEQMKLWRTAGVNPLGGCIPALLQIPIFMSLYYFFQSNIALRGKNFLWAQDLAQYDSIFKLPFPIPFYGDHVSLFTITATLTSLAISLYSMNQMQDQNNPVMKYMPYIFPIMLLGVFNNLPAALTWYYTVSNIITLLLQFVIQKYIINHDKILVQIAENRKKPVKKSKLQERIEAMQETQKKMQELKSKTTKK